jgi:rhodanese-related sulfurtransferase
MPSSVKEMLAVANTAVAKITAQDAAALIAGADALVVDVRDAPELQSTGKVRGATHVSRGMIEFRADPESPYHDKAFNRDKTVIVYCASGGRSALAGKALQDLGYRDVRNLDEQIRKGEFSELLGWLRKKIHQFGHKYDPQDLVQRITGSKITPEPYVRYLSKKYSEIYGL